eukprot:GHVS01018525.1.p2 GENE.GHVS01018525.1~~GHVS01018525.1.p2  ORF type:complete len:211 (-),score=78.87 GHVS01018525.1:841-1473(-)
MRSSLCRSCPSAVGVVGRRLFSSSSFDVFKKMADPPEGGDADKKRKPSDKVLKLVDNIMCLTLIEAADLCDLCQEKLAERSGGSIPGRSPFPHPMAMFAGMGGGPMPPGMSPPATAAAAASEVPSAAAAAPTEPAKEEKKEFVNVKLVSFEKAKKVAVVKEVRSITVLGLKESKELVEEAPKLVKKRVPVAEAEEMKRKLEAAGGEVILE